MRVLVVDDDARIRSSLKGLLEDESYEVTACGSGEEAVDCVREERYDAVILDVMLPGMDGLQTLKHIIASRPALKVLMMSGQASLSIAVEATRSGAVDFFEKPVNGDRVLLALRHIYREQTLEKQLNSLQALVDREMQIIGKSASMERLIGDIRRAAPTASRVLISGENGTGKELVARTVHRLSSRKEGAFVTLNCAAIPAELVESELFGHEKGAFTGAVARKAGKFETADGGTLFLDEIGDMSLSAQAKLLRVLQENEAVRVGGTEPYAFDVRVIAATNKNLKEEIAGGRFREDLFYRLNVIPLTVPPLRERLGDVPLLAAHFIRMIGSRSAVKARSFSDDALTALAAYSWPGNVRELHNTVERLMIMHPAEIITGADVARILPGEETPPPAVGVVPADSDKSFREQVEDFERRVLESGYRRTNGNVSELSRVLKMDRANLHRKLKQFGIKP
ncbi:sigma-54-dependent Fis family transcriptional regulator [bacterium]|nr:sigma-54-dependent Fis family transcriptional regulator [bacterium]